MKLDEIERQLFDEQQKTIKDLKEQVKILEERIKTDFNSMKAYELKRDKLLSKLLDTHTFVKYQKELESI